MDTCTNCGAVLRPGAKFCTTCGTRLNDAPTDNTGWGNAVPSADTTSQETSAISTVQPLSASDEPATIREPKNQSDARWTSAYAAPTTGNDPASRFIFALDEEVKPAPTKDATTSSTPESTWTVPEKAAFTPPAPSWSFSGDEDAPANLDEGKTEPETGWEAPATWNAVASKPTEDEADAAGFSDDGDDEIDYLSGDENIKVSGKETPVLPPDDARDRAIELADELRRMLRMMSAGGIHDHGAAAMALMEASLNVGDFSDLRGALVDVKNDPRDIRALGNLAAKADRIEALMDSHTVLADAIDTAIKELNG